MEYIGGCNLKQLIKSRSPMSIVDIKAISKKLLNGLKFLHENNIIHRDLKVKLN
jgi:serine/threonine protein kinase